MRRRVVSESDRSMNGNEFIEAIAGGRKLTCLHDSGATCFVTKADLVKPNQFTGKI